MSDEGWDEDTTVRLSGNYTTQKTPMVWLWAAVAAAVGGFVLAALHFFRDLPISLPFAGWALAGPVGMALLALFQSIDTKRRAGSYSESNAARSMFAVATALLLLAVIACALCIALWAGRR